MERWTGAAGLWSSVEPVYLSPSPTTWLNGAALRCDSPTVSKAHPSCTECKNMCFVLPLQQKYCFDAILSGALAREPLWVRLLGPVAGPSLGWRLVGQTNKLACFLWHTCQKFVTCVLVDSPSCCVRTATLSEPWTPLWATWQHHLTPALLQPTPGLQRTNNQEVDNHERAWSLNSAPEMVTLKLGVAWWAGWHCEKSGRRVWRGHNYGWKRLGGGCMRLTSTRPLGQYCHW